MRTLLTLGVYSSRPHSRMCGNHYQEDTYLLKKTKMSSEQVVLAPLSPTSVSQVTNCVLDDQLKALVNLVEDDNRDEACPFSETLQENVTVSFANLFDYKDNQDYLVKETIPPPPRLETSIRTPRGQCSIISDDDAISCKTSEKRSVSFAPSHQVIQLVNNRTEGLEQDLWYSRYDFKTFEEEACLCSQMIQDIESQGTFDGELGDILGLEKIILCESYLDRRDCLRTAVMDEQAVQQMVKQIRSRQGCGSDDIETDDFSLVQLASTSERLSLWARERASMAAFTLEHDLNSCDVHEGRFEGGGIWKNAVAG
jgi:hypothetical protein